MTLIALGMPVGIAGCGLLLQYLPAQVAMLTLAAAMAVVTASRPVLSRTPARPLARGSPLSGGR